MEPYPPRDGTSQGKAGEDRPRLVVNFRPRCKVTRITAAELCKHAAEFKYQITSLHLPVEHHYVDRKGDANPPWIASVTLDFPSLEEFAKYTFAWRKNHQESFFSPWGINFDSHPTVEGVTMFTYRQHIDCFCDSTKKYWKATITVGTRDLQAGKLPKEFSEAALAALFNKDTCVCMEAFYTEQTADKPLGSRRRVFVKYPAERDTDPPKYADVLKTSVDDINTDRRFGVNTDKAIQFEDPELYKAIEDNIERQLFTHKPGDCAIQLFTEPDDVEGQTCAKESDGGRGMVRSEIPTVKQTSTLSDKEQPRHWRKFLRFPFLRRA